jgi:hypothetical protein
MTNDNDFAERLTNPDQGPQDLSDQSRRPAGDEQLERLQRCRIERRPAPRLGDSTADGARHTFLELTITEGRNRQVRRMLEAVGGKVLKLVRIAIGPIRIGDLPIGTWRTLMPDEVAALSGRDREESKRTATNPNTTSRPQPPRSTSRGNSNRSSPTSGNAARAPRRGTRSFHPVRDRRIGVPRLNRGQADPLAFASKRKCRVAYWCTPSQAGGVRLRPGGVERRQISGATGVLTVPAHRTRTGL